MRRSVAVAAAVIVNLKIVKSAFYVPILYTLNQFRENINALHKNLLSHPQIPYEEGRL